MNFKLSICLSIIFVISIFSFSAKGEEALKPGEWISVSKAIKTKGLKAYANGTLLGNCDQGDWAEFGPFDLSDGLVDRIEIEIASPQSAGSIEFHLDKTDGDKIAEISIKETGSYSNYGVLQGHCEQLSGNHRIFLIFKGGNNLCNIKAFRILKPGQKGSSNIISGDKTESKIDLKSEIEKILSANEEGINKNRTTVIKVLTPPNASIKIQQQRHAFEFGTAISKYAFVPNKKFTPKDQEKYRQILKANFNSVVHENAMKWYSNEREGKDKLDFSAAETMLDWCEKNNLFTRGHCVYWGRDNLVQKWLKALDDESLGKQIKERAKDYMAHYSDRVPEHDVNNEMIHCHYYKKRLGPEIRKKMFEWCSELDPKATLYVNDYSILSGGKTDAYIKQIEGFLKDGMKVGGIGVQGHFGGRVNGVDVKKKLDKLAKFGLPIKVTEFDLNTKNEHLKAKSLVTLYATAFAHPAVKGIYMWGFWKRLHWRPKAGLWDADWSETPGAKWYREIVFKRWWSDFAGKADANGVCEIRVFLGEQKVTVNGKSRTFKINKNTGQTTIDCRASKSEKWILKNE